MTRRLIAALATLGLALVMALAVAAPANADHGTRHNSVNNSGYSVQVIKVCGEGGICANIQPGSTAWQTTTPDWNPNQVAVCPYCAAKYRAVKGTTVLSGWVDAWGGRFGTWIDAGAVHRMWGNDGIEVQVMISGPHY